MNGSIKQTDVIIIGAGPVGLFAVHQLGIKGLKAVVIDNLDKAGRTKTKAQVAAATGFPGSPKIGISRQKPIAIGLPGLIATLHSVTCPSLFNNEAR